MEVASLDTKQSKIDILGVAIDNITMAEAGAKVNALRENAHGGYVITPNPEIIFHSQKDPALTALINGARILVADGVGVVKAANILKRPLKSRVPGVELGEAILPDAAKRGDRLFIYGAKPGVAEEAGKRLAAKYPGLFICGTADGYGKDDAALCAKITEAQPDLMFGLGGSVDIYSGMIRRAPKFWRVLNLEWFYRLACQPKRISRFVKSMPRFFRAVRRQRKAEKKAARKK